MSTIVSTILSGLSTGVVKLLFIVFGAVKEAFIYLNNKRNDKKEEIREKVIQEANSKIDAACDSGGLDDLLNATEELGKARAK